MIMKKDDLQTIDQIRLLNQKNALKSNNKLEKWKGLDKITVNLPIFSVKVHVVYPLSRDGWTLLDHENSSSSP
jgi:hypothetical protein